MTRDEWVEHWQILCAYLPKTDAHVTVANKLLDHEAEQRRVIARLREALEGILEIGKRDMTNPKYDVYFEQAQQALKDSQTSK